MDKVIEHPEDAVLKRLIQWAESRKQVRAVLVTSTRAIPGATVDELSDYDVILVVEDIHPFFDDRKWLEDFGEVLVVYWDPVYADPDHGIEKTGNVTQYADGLKIDFTFWPVGLLRKIAEVPTLQAELDAGYRILLDKDRITVGLKPPTYRAYIPTPPTRREFLKHINDFFSDAPYAAKCLVRGELFPLKWCLEYDMKHVYLRPMLEWLLELDRQWSLPVGALGKGLKKRLLPGLWLQLEETYAGASLAENWGALFRTIALFRQVAMEVGERLGYEYPLELDERVTAFVRAMQRQQRHDHEK